MIQLADAEPGTIVTDHDGFWGPFLVTANDGERVSLLDQDGEAHTVRADDDARPVTVLRGAVTLEGVELAAA